MSKCMKGLLINRKMYAKAIRILSKGYLPISLLPPSKLSEILGEVKRYFRSQIEIIIWFQNIYIYTMT